MIDADRTIDGVLLDVNLNGEMAFEVADTLQSQNIPYVFVTGYDRAALPDRFVGTERLQKPVDPQQLVQVLSRLTASEEANATV